MAKFEVVKKRRLLDDFFKVDEATFKFERFDGTISPPTRRLVFERGDSTAAVVVDTDRESLLFTEQFRFATAQKGPGHGWLVELIAGVVDDGESPEDSLRRELKEELGYEAEHLESVATFFLSPGGSSERIWLYYVEVSARSRVCAGGGLPAEGEDIRVVSWSMDEVRDRLERGEFADAKTIVGLQWLLARRPR